MTHPLSLKIGVSGVRGIVGQSLTPQLVTSFAAAFGTYCGRGPIIIGTDTRPSREMVTQAAIAGLLSVGCTPISLGVVPVPTLQIHVRETKSAGGICATASHNPLEWNALKFVGADGILLRPNQFAELLDLYHQGDHPRVGAHEIADVGSDDTAIRRHRETVLESVQVDAIRDRRLTVAIDCCNGAGSLAAPAFLRALGCQVVEVFTHPEDGFSRDPEPSPENLRTLCEKVQKAGADIGFALDSDADRLALVDAQGHPLGEDYTVALVARHVLGKNPGPVVVDVSSSRMIDDVARDLGCPVYRTRVGEVNVVEKMLDCNARIGGESNGGVIAPAINPCRDSFVGMAFILEALATSSQSLDILRSQLPKYARATEQIPCRARDVAPALRLFRDRYGKEELDLTDGVKVNWPDRWLHVRGSNTEPILRIKAEAKTLAEARTLAEAAREVFRPIVR
jgi:phosphomannomutase